MIGLLERGLCAGQTRSGAEEAAADDIDLADSELQPTAERRTREGRRERDAACAECTYCGRESSVCVRRAARVCGPVSVCAQRTAFPCTEHGNPAPLAQYWRSTGAARRRCTPGRVVINHRSFSIIL